MLHVFNYHSVIDDACVARVVSSHKCHSKKVRFSEDVVLLELSSKNKWYLEKHPSKLADQNSITSLTAEKVLGSMPLNRQVLYKGILKYRTKKGKNMISNWFRKSHDSFFSHFVAACSYFFCKNFDFLWCFPLNV